MNKYVLKKRIGNKGCYAEIFFDVTLLNEPSNGLTVKYLADSRWATACNAGILIFYDYFSRVTGGKLEITIHEIKWMPVDTNNLLVMYACIEALKEALKIPLEKVRFDTATEMFIFPEVRSVGNG